MSLEYFVYKMGVDLATYRARIGTLIRNVSCSDEKHSPVSVKRKWKDGKGVCKVSDRVSCPENFRYVIFRISLCFEKNEKWLDVHICANVEFGNKPHGPNEVCVQVRIHLYILSVFISPRSKRVNQISVLVT